jgi:hypothetical protein
MQFKQGDVYSFSLDRFYAGLRSTVIPQAPPGFAYPGDPGFHGRSGMPNNYKNIDPRVAVAWDPTGSGKTAIRVGAGIAHAGKLCRRGLEIPTARPREKSL